jgi:hypothetical protein
MNRRKIDLVIGLGTGRCGTWSLFTLLDLQKGCYCYHEGINLPWKVDLVEFWRKLYRMINIELDGPINKGLKIISNIGWYWINYIPELMSQVKNPRCICLTRPRQEVVESFGTWSPPTNHWTHIKSKHWRPGIDNKGKYPEGWPSYDLPKDEAIGAYWDEYHKKAEFWAWKFPNSFRIFPVETLNTNKGVKDLLKFAGFPVRGQVREVGIKFNTRDKPKGFFEKPDFIPGRKVIA